jgi:hypothetical protein
MAKSATIELRNAKEITGDFKYEFRWNRMGRKGQRCAVVARGSMNSCCVRFEDGFEAVTSRNALRRAE